MSRSKHRWWLALAVLAVACSSPAEHELVLRGGTVYDGSGDIPFIGDIAIDDDTISHVFRLSDGAGEDRPRGVREIDVTGLAVSPGFINMLSWANETLLVDGRGESDIRQGVTLEVFGEGWSMGPLNEAMKADMREDQGDLRFEVEWTTLGQYLEHLVKRGVSPNVASFVGATTVRIHEVGYEDRPATEQELARMQELVRDAMREGALGVGSSLIYAPAFSTILRRHCLPVGRTPVPGPRPWGWLCPRQQSLLPTRPRLGTHPRLLWKRHHRR